MNIGRKLFAPIAIQDRQNRVLSVDLPAFVTRLLLFDQYILQSVWLEDLILLQHSLGTSGLSHLLESQALKVYCPAFTFGQTGQARPALRPNPMPPLPLFNYEFSSLRVQGAEEKIERTLATLDSGLRKVLVKARLLEPADYPKTLFDAFYRDLKTELLDFAVRARLRRFGIIPVSHKLSLEQISEDQFSVENDLAHRYLLPRPEVHRIIESAMMALGSLDERIAKMRAHSAITGLSQDDRSLLDAKLGLTASLVDPMSHERAFSRLVALKGLPVPEYGSSVVDIKALLKIRDSDECRAFKEWLSGSEKLSEKELRERVSGFGRRIQQTVHSRVGKALRFVVSTGLGVTLGAVSPVYGAAAGIALNATDFFLLERLVPKDAVISILSEGYPSLFSVSDKQT